ncbi:fimbria/pilus periplasmic chaperone [Vibrio rotiferianus]|uniref:fimbria/pilus periplasmic chaperone n=1 Tax=Vibrio rotiferianus TaxID=190895 RepID=UPI00406A1C58
MRVINLLVFILIIISYPSSAIIISPTVLELNTSKTNNAQLVVTNNSNNKLPLEVTVKQLVFTSDGKYTTRHIVTDEILVFPPAAMLMPGKNQTFRVQWLNSKPISQSESYFIRFSEAKVKTNEDNPHRDNVTTDVDLNIHYNALVHVFDQTLRPRVYANIDKLGAITLQNKGDRYTFSSLIRFSDLNSEANTLLQSKIGQHFLPPHSSIKLPSTSTLPAGRYHGKEQ